MTEPSRPEYGIVRFLLPAPDGDVFAPGALDRIPGSQVRMRGLRHVVVGTVVEVRELPDGRYAEVAMRVPAGEVAELWGNHVDTIMSVPPAQPICLTITKAITERGELELCADRPAMSLDEATEKITAEYGDALRELGER